jgi:hypothetical protein
VAMTCRDYERGWNELIDLDRAGSVRVDPVSADTESALLDHAAGCPACRELGARYQVLRRALQAGFQPQAPPVGLTDRILAEIDRPSPSAWAVYGEVRRERFPRALVAIAAILVAMALPVVYLNQSLRRAQLNRTTTVLHPTPGPRGHNESPDSETVAVDARNLNTALAEATAATWDLARSASEPAARISRQVLSAATEGEREPSLSAADARPDPGAAGVSVPSLAALAPDTAAAEAILQQVGDRLATGVRPLSDTARHAFSFLLGPASAKPDVPPNPPAPKGA